MGKAHLMVARCQLRPSADVWNKEQWWWVGWAAARIGVNIVGVIDRNNVHVHGSGEQTRGCVLKAYDKAKYSTLEGYANDVVEIGRELGLKDAVFVGHSVSSMIGALAVEKAPGMFGKLVMVGPSARYIDDGDYIGGFSERQIDELLQFLELNHMGL